MARYVASLITVKGKTQTITVYTKLPNTLAEALEMFETEDAVLELLGERLIQKQQGRARAREDCCICVISGAEPKESTRYIGQHGYCDSHWTMKKLTP